MNLIFAGTPAFAVPALRALVAAGHRVPAVYTQPDRPAGRGRKPAASAVKQAALALGLAVRQPERLDNAVVTELRADAPDAVIVIAYGLLLPPAILSLPRHGCINVHASLLPRWRGAAPIPRALEAGDTVTGVSIMQMDAGLDTGPVLAEAETPIGDSDTAATLYDRLAGLGAQTLVATLERLARGETRPRPQDPARACYAKKLRKAEAALDWSQEAAVLHRRIRAFIPWPVAATTFRGKQLRLWGVGPLDAAAATAAAGTVLAAEASGLRVAAGKGVLTLTQVQLEGGRVLSAREFLSGQRVAPGELLGRSP